jgi:predicted nuclease of predicted toxin-antitoxin system
MLRFLLNANISHETAQFLNSLGCDAKTATQFGLGNAEDSKIAGKAIKEKRILVTFDLDFGEIFYFSKEAELWIIILKLHNQTVESVNKNLKGLLDSKILEDKNLKNTLMIVSEGSIRVRRKP